MPGYFLLKPGFSSVTPAAQGEVTYAILSPGLAVEDAVSWLPVHGTPT
jgi:hypothetical protein